MFQINNDPSEIRLDAKEMFQKLSEKYYGDHEYERAWKEVDIALTATIQERKQLTCGNFKTEVDACKYFDSLVNQDYFYNEQEVRGRRLFDDKPTDSEQMVRIDRILFPTSRAFDSGWKYGPIAVEVKKSNMAVGPIFSQVLEYRQSIFISKYFRNTRIMPLIFAIFPLKGIYHDLHSLQENQIILSCHPQRNYSGSGFGLKFGTSGSSALEIMPNCINIFTTFCPNTRKGHRGREK